MKKNFKSAFLSAIALLGAVSFSACSSSDDVIDNPNYDPATNTVKTQFCISLPANVKTPTRMASTEVPDNNNFRGMENIVLIPFSGAPITSTSKRLGANIVLPGTTNNLIEAGTDKLNTGNNSKLFNDVTIPVNTKSFLLYGKAIDGTAGSTPTSDADLHKYGFLTPPDLSAEPSTFTFTPKQIYSTTGDHATATAIAEYLTEIANAQVDESNKWSNSTDEDLSRLYNLFIKNKAGSSNSVKSLVADLYKTLCNKNDGLSEAIRNVIKTKCTPTDPADGTIASWDTSIDGYPSSINLPDGAAAVTFTSGSFAPANGTIYNTTALGNYVYPASLYYFVNSQIKTDNASKATEYTSTTNDTWDKVLATYTNDNASVQPNTLSVAIKNPIDYAVGRFDVTVKTINATLYDYYGDEIDATNGFTVTAVFVGGQNAVGFDFKPSAEGSMVIYDNAVADGTTAKTTPSNANRTMVLETLANKDVNVVVELTNDIKDFYGKDGQLIKKDTKFYMVGVLTASQATSTESCVFKQDYITTANFTIKQGDPKTTPSFTNNTEGLGNAYNVIPDLRTPQLELGMSVDLNWRAGHTYDVAL